MHLRGVNLLISRPISRARLGRLNEAHSDRSPEALRGAQGTVGMLKIFPEPGRAIEKMRRVAFKPYGFIYQDGGVWCP